MPLPFNYKDFFHEEISFNLLKKRKDSNKIISEGLEPGYIGIVKPDGSVDSLYNNFSANETDHSEIAHVLHGKWRYFVNSRLLYWNEDPSDEERHIMYNWLTKRGLSLKKEVTSFNDLEENKGMNMGDNFKSWFGRSVVKDKGGNPLRVYHGTNQPIKSFSKMRRGMTTHASSAKEGYFFTDSSEVASQYASAAGKQLRSNLLDYEKKVKQYNDKLKYLEHMAHRTGKWDAYEKTMEEYEEFELAYRHEDDIIGQNLIPVYLRIENPLIYDFEGNSAAIGNLTNIILTAKKNGNDGVILKNIADPLPVSNHYVVFKSTQIKSATGNGGGYNPKKSDITKEDMDTPSQPPGHVQHVDKQNQNVNIVDQQQMKDAYVVAATLWGEARGEGENGMHAVMNVIMNRAHGDFSKAKDIVLKKKQFSLWNNVKDPEASAINLAQVYRSKKLKDGHSYIKALELVDKAMKGNLPDITGGATFYFNPKKVMPSWAKEMIKTKTIGNHDFYKPMTKTHQLDESDDGINIIRQGLVDDGIIGYEMRSPKSFIRYGYEPTRKLFYLYMVGTPNTNDRNQGHSKSIIDNFFQLIKQYNGTLDVGSYTGEGMDYVKHVIERLAKQYRIRLI